MRRLPGEYFLGVFFIVFVKVRIVWHLVGKFLLIWVLEIKLILINMLHYRNVHYVIKSRKQQQILGFINVKQLLKEKNQIKLFINKHFWQMIHFIILLRAMDHRILDNGFLFM